MNAVPQTPEWSPSSWTSRPAQQQPSYKDPVALARAVDSLGRLPPIVVSWEVEALKRQIAEAQRGERFLLQGGDCAESFADCDSGQIARKLKILLQMSLVLLHGMKKPVIRVGRFAGQYAKPRSTDTETKDGVTLPCYRGDLVNRPGFTAAEREPDPELLLRGYERAALTLNFVRALIDGGFADLHHPEYWDLGFVKHSPLADPVPADRHVDRGLARFLRGDERQPGARGEPRTVLREPRGAAPAVRAGADAFHSAQRALVQPVDAPALDRHAHGRSRRRARRILPRHLESGRREGRPVDGCGVGAGSLPHAQSEQGSRAPGADPSHGREERRGQSCPA